MATVKKGRSARERVPSTAKQTAATRRNRRRNDERAVDTTALRRIASYLAKTSAAIFGIGAIAYGATRVIRGLGESETFRVEKIEIAGTNRAERDALLSLAGIEAGEGLLAVDPAEIEKRLAQHPWVARAHVERRFPRTLAIEVTEHRPVAFVALGSLYYVNEEGAVVKRHAPGEKDVLPVITGLDREAVKKGDGEALGQIRTALAFLDEWHKVNGGKQPIAELHVDAAGLSFVLAGEDLRVYVGPPPWRERLAQLEEVRRTLQERGAVAKQIALGGERRPERVTAQVKGTGH